MKIIGQIKTRGRLIPMGNLVPYLVPFHIIKSLIMTEIILSPWEREGTTEVEDQSRNIVPL